ncbi:hypothetical protein [Sedimenticola hydrogenitrophicus]|uniref:hypothetical protein n=1 Tax=Sedimenticola hydrogenitrophicus TaxID=2967975 RepID=UPI0023B02198|nr:hypothetical protein [Sedimenticola hydrogenitrophicus]
MRKGFTFMILAPAIIYMIVVRTVNAGWFGYDNYQECVREVRKEKMEAWFNSMSYGDANRYADDACYEYLEKQRESTRKKRTRQTYSDEDIADARKQYYEACMNPTSDIKDSGSADYNYAIRLKRLMPITYSEYCDCAANAIFLPNKTYDSKYEFIEATESAVKKCTVEYFPKMPKL